jgi:hypothetical protein
MIAKRAGTTERDWLTGIFRGVDMTKAPKLTAVVFLLAAGCWTQNLLSVQVKSEQRWPAQGANKLYFLACSAVQQEFGGTLVRPQVTLVPGPDTNEALWDRRETRLIKMDPHLLAQG